MINLIRRVITRIQFRKKVKWGRKAYSIKSLFEGKNSVGEGSVLRNCSVGRCSYLGRYVSLNCVKIGRYSSIADGVITCLGNHPTKQFVTTHPAFYYDTESQIGFSYHKGEPLFNGIMKYPKNESKYQIVIGNDVWVGGHVLILGGVTIGDGAIVAAGSVVTKDVAPYSIVAGIPAHLIRFRFEANQIAFLLDNKWWNMSEDYLKANHEDFSDINKFYEKYKNNY